MTYHFTREDSPMFFYRVAVDDIDTDGDGFTDHEEYQSGGDPLVAERDGDGLSDAWEIANNLNPDDDGITDPDNGADGDPDGDGVNNAEEYLAGTDPGDGEDYLVQVIRIGRTAIGQSNLIPYQHENQPPYNGTSSRGAEWEQEPYQEAFIEDSPVTVDYLDGLQASVAFPPTPPDPDWGRSTLNPGSQISSRSRLTLPVGAATISGFVTSTRVWLKAPKQATEQSFHFVRVKRSSIHNLPAKTNTEEYQSTTPVRIVIPANQDISLPIDLKNTPGTVADSDGHWYDELREITVSWRVWGDFDNLEDHIDRWTGRRKGQRIFPGSKNPDESTLRAKVRVVVSSSPSLVGQTAYVKSFDVDDSTSEDFDKDDAGSLPVIDTNGKAGNDNLADYLGTGGAGQFWDNATSVWGGNTASAVIDVNGDASFDFRVGMQPGNNYRVVASVIDESMYSGVQTDSPSAPKYLGPELPQTGSAPASPLLSVWRKLWVENDSMEAISVNQPGGNSISSGTISEIFGIGGQK